MKTDELRLKGFRIPVLIKGIARVYARNNEEAQEVVEHSIPFLAGNSMIEYEVEITGTSMAD